LEFLKKVTTKSPRSVLKNKTKAEEGGALGLGIKREHDIRFLKDEEHLHLDGDIDEVWMETIGRSQHF